MVLATVGTALLVTARVLGPEVDQGWLGLLPLREFGSTLLATGVLAVLFEYLDRRHGEERTDQRLRGAIRAEAPAIRDVVLESFAIDPQRLRGVVSPALLDRIIPNALALRMNNPAHAQALYTGLRQVIDAPETYRDVSVQADLSAAEGFAGMFAATLRWSYRVHPTSPVLRFACVGDQREADELTRDPSIVSAWYVEPSAVVDPTSPEVFTVAAVTVDGQPVAVRRDERPGGQIYTATLPSDALGRDVAISYSYRVLIRRRAHVLYLTIPRPTEGFTARLSYAGAGIRHVTALSFLSGTVHARVEATPREVPARSVEIALDGWINPHTGVAFVWVLDTEPEPGPLPSPAG
jgi:hypothetical protein